MCHSPPTAEMWLDAIMSTYRARASINARLAELQEERERVCECNQPGYQAPPPVEHAPRVQPSPEELAARQAARAARIQAVVEAKARYLRDRGEYARPRPPRREIPRDLVPADPDRPDSLSGGAAASRRA